MPLQELIFLKTFTGTFAIINATDPLLRNMTKIYRGYHMVAGDIVLATRT